MNYMKSDDLGSLVVCGGCLAILPTGTVRIDSSNEIMKDELFRIANVKVADFIPVSLCPQCKDIVTLFKSFRIQVFKANTVLSDLIGKFQRGKSIKSRHLYEERSKYILPRIVLTAKDDKTLSEILKVQTNPTSDGILTMRAEEAKNTEIKNLNVTFADNLISDTNVVNSTHDIKRLLCTDDNCNKVFPNIISLKNHTSLVHMKTKKDNIDSFFCPVVECKHSMCNRESKPFANRGLLKQHYVKVHVQKKFSCFKCEMKFPTIAMCSRHEKACSQNIVCSHCSIKFIKQESFISHLMRKHPQKYREYLQRKKSSRAISKKTGTENLLDSKGVGSECAVPPIEPAPNTTTQSETPLKQTSSETSSDTLIGSVSECNLKTPGAFAVFSDQFTQTAIKTVPKQKPNTERSSAQTQTFERSSCNKSAGYFTNIYMKTGVSYVEESTGQAVCQDTAMVLDAQISTNDKTKQSISNNQSPLLSFSSFDSTSQSVTFDSNLPVQSNSTTIETQTSLDELLYSNRDIDSNLFSELVSLSDIQTQTVWDDSGDLNYERQLADAFGPMDLMNCFDKRSVSPVDFEKSSRTARNLSPIPPTPMSIDLLSNLTSSPDLTFKGTQTYFSFGDSPKQAGLINSKWI